jgi:hypothetical protein
MTREQIIYHWDAIVAFKEGKVIQYYDEVDKHWCIAYEPSFRLDIKFRIKPESTKRLPTIEEVEQWFLENRVFIYKEKTILHRMQSLDRCNRNGQLLQIGSVWITVEDFSELYTHYNGEELYFNE